MRTICILAAVSLATIACSRSTTAGPTAPAGTPTSASRFNPSVTPVLPALTPVAAALTEMADPNGACHSPQYFGEGTIYWESKNVCIVRGKASRLLLARIQATTLNDFNARKTFAESKLIELVRDTALTPSEVCDANNRTGLFTEQADLGGAGDTRLSRYASEQIGCAR